MKFGYMEKFEGEAENLNWPGGLSSKGCGVGLWLGTKPILPKQSSSKPDVIALLKSNATYGCIDPVFCATAVNLSTYGCITRHGDSCFPHSTVASSLFASLNRCQRHAMPAIE